MSFSSLPRMRPMALAMCASFATLAVSTAFAQPSAAQTDVSQTETAMPVLTVKAPVTSFAEQAHLPNTNESITGQQALQTTNTMNTEDMLKYVPSLLVRKRYIGDTNAPVATRTTGINASARSLIYVDGLLLSTLINNNNGNGSPQWFMVAPEEVERIDVIYGPFAAKYPGNSYGAVTAITTRMPDHFEASIKLGTASQRFSSYGHRDDYPASQANVFLGNRSGALSWSVSASHLDSFSQPVTYMTATQSTTQATAAAPLISGAVAGSSRTGSALQILGQGNLTHTLQDAVKLRFAYDFSPSVTLGYSLGYWQNSAKATAQSYLATPTGQPYYGGTNGTVNLGGYAYSASTIGSLFSSNTVDQQRWMQAVSLQVKNQGDWSWDAQASMFDYARDLTRTSTGLYPAAQYGGPGRISDASGTGWQTFDLNGEWHRGGSLHTVNFGAHIDQYKLVNPVYSMTDWANGGNGALYSDARGKTRTSALWAQDAWRLAPTLLATIGARFEWWKAFDGSNLSTASSGQTFSVQQPTVSNTGISPKASLRWQANDLWSLTGSFGKALRFPTVGELYQNVQTGTTYTQANPYLKPERVLSEELALERVTAKGHVRLSLFQEDIKNALISQTASLPGVALPVSYVQNIDATRQRGFELAVQQSDVAMRGLDLSGSLTYVNALITGNSSYVATSAGATSVGKRVPYVPKWRASVAATYRPDARWAYTAALRYSSRLYATVDNTDSNPGTYQGFQGFTVADLHIALKVNQHWQASAGIDNVTNRQYFLFHPFPGRTVFADIKYTF